MRVLVDEGPGRVDELIRLGAVFDREADGDLALAREGGHSTARVLHAGGAATGAEVERALVSAVRRSAAAVLEQWFALDLVVEGGRCVGVRALDPGGEVQEVRATQVVLATGGAGQLYAVTTNPPEATGDGIAMALRAGVPVADLEFFQFHPTALHHPAMPRPLLSEALRGHGAILRDAEGERFVDELAPRDIVSRAMADRMAAQGVGSLWLDATGLESFGERFPTVAASLHGAGLDPAVDWLPIAPAAHYLSGGVVTDLDGASALPGLWAVGEVACTGVHGANRLASNSLLEGMVFGARLAEALSAGRDGPTDTGVMRAPRDTGPTPRAVTSPAPTSTPPTPKAMSWWAMSWRAMWGSTIMAAEVDIAGAVDAATDVAKLREHLQRAMIEGAGVLRSPDSLAGAAAEVGVVARELGAGRGRAAHGGATVTGAPPVSSPTSSRCRGRCCAPPTDATRRVVPTPGGTSPTRVREWRRRLVHRGACPRCRGVGPMTAPSMPAWPTSGPPDPPEAGGARRRGARPGRGPRAPRRPDRHARARRCPGPGPRRVRVPTACSPAGCAHWRRSHRSTRP